MAVSDSNELRPHNMARHALVRPPLPWPKAFELSDELALLGQKPEAHLIDVVRGLKRADNRLLISPPGTGTLLNTTASSLVRDALSMVSPAELPARMAEIALFGRGRGGFVFHKGSNRNPSLADLQAVLSATVTPYERTLLFDPEFGLTQIQIGEGCGSMTMPMTDARLSAMTAMATEELMRLAGANADGGELVVGVAEPDSPSTSWRRLSVSKFLEIPVEGSEWTLRLSSHVAGMIREETARFPNVETGGLLIGSCSSLMKTVTVVDLIEAPEDSVRTPTLFVLGTKGKKNRIDARFEESGRSLLDVGTWHSHLAEQGPSPTDRKTAKQVAVERAPPAILSHCHSSHVPCHHASGRAMNDYLDAYSIKARLAPAALAIAPVIVLIVLAFNWVQPSLPEAIIGLAVMVLFFAASNVARRLGKRKERQLFATTGGRPENRELNHLDKTLDERTKDRYRKFLAKQLEQPAPTRDMEVEDPDEAAAFYVQCYNWLRENTRDTEKFRILFNENIAYGYYRNLLALKPYGIVLNLLTIAAAAAIIYYKPDFACCRG
ncbi:Mov34/MPN/PAD-1 family protein [Mesorhizobium sp.]|uniref:Mov34/MPN/PAD-1 family protein n=1 Tax=Mesorhizobium sp. TaxID=1871066 RepID=UPI0025D58E3C|nr:Mov34/MPN/PAD-1 family protein [Mesorhizobium sp.]